jgi:DHA1 family multidrug resistance protein-like MFS transporter
VFILFQCVFVYLPMVYPAYAGSLFAGNDTMRSTLAAAAILFSRPMFLGLGVGGGVSLLAGLTTLCIGGIFILFFYGEKLRAKSRFAAK